MSEDQLDRIYRNIVAALSRDARLSMAELGRKVGLSKTPVMARVRRLERDGYIRGYAAIVDRERMSQGHIAFVQVKRSDTRSAALDAFNKAALAVPEIEQCHMIASSFDYLLIDTAAGIGESVLAFIRSAQYTILVISTEPTSLTDAFALLRVLKRQAHERPAYVLVNMALNYANSMEVYKRFEGAVRKYLGLKVHYLLTLWGPAGPKLKLM